MEQNIELHNLYDLKIYPTARLHLCMKKRIETN